MLQIYNVMPHSRHNELKTIKDLLAEAVKTKSEESTAKTEVTGTNNTQSIIVVEKSDTGHEPNQQEISKTWSEVAKAAISEKAGVTKSYTNKVGQTIFVCNSDKSKQALLPHVEKAFTGRTINTPKPRLPTISVPFIHGKYGNEELLDVLRAQNEDRGILLNRDNAQVMFTTPMRDRDGLYQAVIRVSNEVRDKIKSNGDRLYIGVNSCPVFDRFFIKRCNNCQEYNHFHKDHGGCKKTPVCSRCTGNHDSRTCRTDKNMYQCANCINAGRDDFHHSADSLDCPTYIAEQEKLKKSISYYNTKNF